MNILDQGEKWCNWYLLIPIFK